MKRVALLLAVILLFSCKEKINPKKTLLTNSKIIKINVNSISGTWQIDSSINPDILDFESTKTINKVSFISDIDSISFDVKERDSIFFDIVLKEKDTAKTGITCYPKIIKNHNPLKATIHTEDIKTFWKAYHLAKGKEFNKQLEIYQKKYFDIASDGMKDYIKIKIGNNVEYFTKHINSHPKFYDFIENNTLKVEGFKPQIMESFKNLKELYPASTFPDIYCGIGAFTSAGTTSKKGLLIGINQYSDTKNTPKDEFSFNELSLLFQLNDVPNLFAHELIHFQQDAMAQDTITLAYAISEGMADFVSELISKQQPNPKLYNWAKGKEKDIWNAFKKDMYFNRYNNWLANANTSTEDNYADQGYWVGYQICKAYYNNTTDKKQAIYDMFHITDYKEFLKKSKWEEIVKSY